MFVFLNILVLLLIASALTFYYSKKKSQLRREILPQQVKLVRSLLRDLAAHKIRITMVSKPDHFLEQYKPFGEMTLPEVGYCLDNNNELALEQYDDHQLFVVGRSQAAYLDNYLNHPLTPAKIRYELSAFRPAHVETVKAPALPCFILNFSGHTLYHQSQQQELCKSSAEPFESWLLFKESAHCLNFVINQWLEENAPALNFELDKNS